MATPEELIELIESADKAANQMAYAYDQQGHAKSVDFAAAYAELNEALQKFPVRKGEVDTNMPILREPGQFLVIPRPQRAMGMVRVEGARMRVRICPRCGSRSTIPACPICGATTRTGDSPTDEAPAAPQQAKETPIPGNPVHEQVIRPGHPRRLPPKPGSEHSGRETKPCIAASHRWQTGLGDNHLICQVPNCGAYLWMPNGAPPRGPCADGASEHDWAEPARHDDPWLCRRCDAQWTESPQGTND